MSSSSAKSSTLRATRAVVEPLVKGIPTSVDPMALCAILPRATPIWLAKRKEDIFGKMLRVELSKLAISGMSSDVEGSSSGRCCSCSLSTSSKALATLAATGSQIFFHTSAVPSIHSARVQTCRLTGPGENSTVASNHRSATVIASRARCA